MKGKTVVVFVLSSILKVRILVQAWCKNPVFP